MNALAQRTDVDTSGTAFSAATALAWGYDSLGQVVKADHPTAAKDFGYAYFGNQINGRFATAAMATGSRTWDGENQLIQTAVTGGATTTYTYDAFHRRVAKRTGTTNVEITVYDGWNPIADYSIPTSSYVLRTSYTWGLDLSGSMQGAGGVGGLLALKLHTGSTQGVFWVTYDGNGNVSEYINNSQIVAAHYEYGPFGELTAATGSAPTVFKHRFSTKPLDAETGYYYYGYRYYDPLSGRWLSRDPIGIQGGFNLYNFAANNSVTFIDLLGLEIDEQASHNCVGPIQGIALRPAFSWKKKATLLGYDATVAVEFMAAEEKSCCVKCTNGRFAYAKDTWYSSGGKASLNFKGGNTHTEGDRENGWWSRLDYGLSADLKFTGEFSKGGKTYGCNDKTIERICVAGSVELGVSFGYMAQAGYKNWAVFSVGAKITGSGSVGLRGCWEKTQGGEWTSKGAELCANAKLVLTIALIAFDLPITLAEQQKCGPLLD